MAGVAGYLPASMWDLGVFFSFLASMRDLGFLLQLSIIVVGLEGFFLQLFPRLSLIEHTVGGPYPCR